MIVKNVEKKENKTIVFQVESDAAEFEKAVNGAYLRNKNQINIPGFRKGKAPRAVVEGMYGPEVFYQDAMDELAPKAFEFGIENSDIRFVGAPSIVDANITEERTAAYTFSVEMYPEVTLGQYKGIEAVREAVVVTDEQVNAEIESARGRNARMVSVEREAQMGDTANINFEGFLDGEAFEGGKGEEYDLVLGSGSFVPGFEEQIVGMQIGEEKDIDITFPENYVEHLAGKAVVFKVKLNSLTFAELPELDDEFAKDVSEFDTLDEYKADLKGKLEKQAKEQAENMVRTEIIKKAADNMTVEIPECMIAEREEEIIRNYASNFGLDTKDMSLDELKQMMGLDEETVKNAIRPNAEFRVKNDLLIEAVVAAEDIQISDEEAEEYLKKVAENINAKPDDIREYFGSAFIREEKKKEIATNIIIDSAVITDAAPAEEKAE